MWVYPPSQKALPWHFLSIDNGQQYELIVVIILMLHT